VVNIVVTGASGTVGKALLEDLSPEHAVTSLSLREENGGVSMDRLVKRLRGVYGVVHAAWNTGLSNSGSNLGDDYNITMSYALLEAANAARVKKFIFVSTVHRQPFGRWPEIEKDHDESVMLPGKFYEQPRCTYGAEKILIEYRTEQAALLGDFYAVNVGLGGHHGHNKPPPNNWQSRVWLSRKDWVSMVRTFMLATPKQRGSYLYGTSANEDPVVSTENCFGWEPMDCAPADKERSAVPKSLTDLDALWSPTTNSQPL
jgi:nucleoside-diphosphate-sugar epimerase